MFNRILVALDGSELSESALPYAEELAGALNPEVVLINAGSQKQFFYDLLEVWQKHWGIIGP